jgi:hypothetical protein
LALAETDREVWREMLCRGLVFNNYGSYSISVEVDGKRIHPSFNNVNRIPKEFITSKEWQNKKLDWNSCICKSLDIEFYCDIEVDAEFDEKLLQYNVVYPASIRVGRKVYRYNRPILTGVNYNGKDYKLYPFRRKLKVLVNIPIDLDIEEPNESILDGVYIPEYNTIK